MNIYHLTLNGLDPAKILHAVRAACGPGSPPASLPELARQMLDAAARIPREERFAAMVAAGLIDVEGRVLTPAPARGSDA